MSKNSNIFRTIFDLIGRQNYLVIFSILFAVVFINSKISTNNLNKEAKPLYSIDATLLEKTNKTTESPKPTYMPKSFIKATPTPNLDPIIDCTMKEECGGGTIQIKRSECYENICCYIGGEKWETLSQEDCTTKQSEYDDEQQQKYEDELKAYNDSWEKYLQELQENNEKYEALQYELDTEYLLQQEANIEYENTKCKKDALDEYQQDKMQITQIYAANNTIESSSYQFDMDKLEDDYQATLEYCDYQYPIN